tara:strand:+ start:1691 stop:2308 length:618 start_codon:yes stop_codon:yes gene_type:complete
MDVSGPKFSDSVFINCPFDREYWPVFEAIVFTIVDAGFVPRCALEEPDSGEVRVQRIQRIVETSKYSLHDISRVELTPEYPRFNMPFELGIDLGCRIYGQHAMKRKRCLILDTERYRYQQFFSDIAGQDIRAHQNSPDLVIKIVRDWLKAVSRRQTIPGPQTIRRHFTNFSAVLPTYCDNLGLDRHDIEFVEYVTMIEEWLKSAE